MIFVLLSLAAICFARPATQDISSNVIFISYACNILLAIYHWNIFLAATVGVPYNEEIVVHSSLNIRNKPQNRQKRQFGPYQWVLFDIILTKFTNQTEAYHILFCELSL